MFFAIGRKWLVVVAVLAATFLAIEVLAAVVFTSKAVARGRQANSSRGS